VFLIISRYLEHFFGWSFGMFPGLVAFKIILGS
jgi:hypothetical protein